jgi:hypothetical protein
LICLHVLGTACFFGGDGGDDGDTARVILVTGKRSNQMSDKNNRKFFCFDASVGRGMDAFRIHYK